MSFGVSYLASLIPIFLDRYPHVDTQLSLGDHLVDLTDDNTSRMSLITE